MRSATSCSRRSAQLGCLRVLMPGLGRGDSKSSAPPRPARKAVTGGASVPVLQGDARPYSATLRAPFRRKAELPAGTAGATVSDDLRSPEGQAATLSAIAYGSERNPAGSARSAPSVPSANHPRDAPCDRQAAGHCQGVGAPIRAATSRIPHGISRAVARLGDDGCGRGTAQEQAERDQGRGSSRQRGGSPLAAPRLGSVNAARKRDAGEGDASCVRARSARDPCRRA
jgi:hypothetical protein